VIELRTGTRIWIAAGYTDLRRGFQGLTTLVETVLEQAPYSGHVFVFRGKRGDLIKLLGGMETDYVCSRRGWSVVGSSGHRHQAVRSRSHVRSCRCCLRASTGASRSAHGNHKQQDKRIACARKL
jgi:IS66 Orf2 like protein